MDQQHIFAVSEVNGLIKDLIDGTPQLSGLYTLEAFFCSFTSVSTP